MSCLAAQVVSHFKEGIGGIYLHPAGTRNCGEEYVYTIYSEKGVPHLRVNYVYKHNRELFDGPVNSYDCDVIQEEINKMFDNGIEA